jgi:hypothetical protein
MDTKDAKPARPESGKRKAKSGMKNPTHGCKANWPQKVAKGAKVLADGHHCGRPPSSNIEWI